jgi:hypothetical protein
VVFLRGRESLQVLFTVYICIDLEDQIIKWGCWDPINLPHVCAYLKPGPDFPSAYVMVFIVSTSFC